jgi:hypothetical protein
MDASEFFGPVNIGSEEMVSINRLAEIAMGLQVKNYLSNTFLVHKV